MSATVTPRWNAATLMRPRSSGVTSIVSRAVKASAFVRLASDDGEAFDPALGIAGTGRQSRACAIAAGHRAILPISAASAAISRAAGLSSSMSKTSRPVRAVSAKATRWPTVAASNGGS